MKFWRRNRCEAKLQTVADTDTDTDCGETDNGLKE